MPEIAATMPASLIEDVDAAWFALQAGFAGVEVHVDSDVTWMLTVGGAWSNAAVRVRFEERTVERRLDTLLTRYAVHGRGAAFWVSALATPADFERRLRARGLHCRKRFPVMLADLTALPDVPEPRVPLAFCRLDDPALFTKHPHPYFGPITTAMRRFALRRQQEIQERRPDQVFVLIASAGDQPLGICTLFKHGDTFGVFDVGVLESARSQGIGTSLMAHASRVARDLGGRTAVLISSGMGESIYRAAGFGEVARIAFWYTAHPQAPAGKGRSGDAPKRVV